MNVPNAEEIARITEAFLAVMSEARALLAASKIGPELGELLQHARELHTLIGEELAQAGAAIGEHAGLLYHAMGDQLKQLDALTKRGN